MTIRADIRDYLDLSALDRDLIGRAETFAREIVAPQAAGWERSRQPGLPASVVKAFVDCGLIGTNVAPEHGGAGAGFLAKIGIVEVLSEVCFPTAFALVNLLMGPVRVARDGTPDQIARYVPDLMSGRRVISLALTEPQSGSDFAATATSARRVPGGWMLEGTKAWVTHAAISDLCIVYAQTDASQRAKGIAAFLVNLKTPGVTIGAPYALETGSIIGICDAHLKDCFVPEADVLQPPGVAFAKALSSINAARTHVAAMCCAMVGSALQIAVEGGRARRAFGRAVVEHQGMRWKVADIAAELEACRLLTYRSAELVTAGKDAVRAAAIAKKASVEMANRCLPECMQMLGANGLRSEYPIARHMLGARIAAFVDGTTEIQKDRIGRVVIG